MKRFLVILVIAVIGVIGLAQQGQGGGNIRSLDVWEITESGSFVQLDEDTGNARAYASMPADGSCNKKVWILQFITEVQVAQWAEWSISATKWTWFVRKPGDYYADAIQFSLKSNGDVQLSAFGFDDLEYATGGGVNRYIETYYYLTTDASNTPPSTSVWVRAKDVNGSITVLDSADLHKGMTAHLWNRIKVVDCNSASTYRDTGTITLTLANQKPWINEDGSWGSTLDYVTEER